MSYCIILHFLLYYLEKKNSAAEPLRRVTPGKPQYAGSLSRVMIPINLGTLMPIADGPPVLLYISDRML